MKQCKLDARREQWLSQGTVSSLFSLVYLFQSLEFVVFVVYTLRNYSAVKNKGCKEEPDGGECRSISVDVHNESDRSLGNSEIRPRVKEENDGSVHHDSDSESPTNSPTGSVLSSTDSRKNDHSSSSSSSSCSASGGCCSGSITEEEEEDDGCLDDWEAVADALAADDKQHTPILESPADTRTVSNPESTNEARSGADILNSESVRMAQRSPGISLAWRPDDAFRPQSLPNLSKQRSFPIISHRGYNRGSVAWACKSVISTPSSCPICYEELDFTDSSFLPCSCGFRLCLFCHKRILEEDGRCPGCRKKYVSDPVEGEACLNGGSTTTRLARSCSMFTRS